MTTTVTITTHGWPVRVTTTDRYQTGETGVTHAEARDYPRWSEIQLVVTNTRTLQIEELPGWEDKPAPETESAEGEAAPA